MSAAKTTSSGRSSNTARRASRESWAIYACGTTGLDQNVTVKLGLDFEAIGEYNKRNFDTKFEEYAMELPAEYYTIDPMSVEMEAGSCSASLPINVRVDELLPDQTYFIPLRIESVSSCMPSATKNFVLFEIQRRNDYATTKSSTYYTMTGTTQTGWIVDQHLRLEHPAPGDQLLEAGHPRG